MHWLAESGHQGIVIPQARLLTLNDEGTFSIALDHGLIGVRPSWMLDSMLAGFRVFFEFEVALTKIENGLAFVPMQPV
ncbi:hypothetical protein D9M71_655310 [compost metagenome]